MASLISCPMTPYIWCRGTELGTGSEKEVIVKLECLCSVAGSGAGRVTFVRICPYAFQLSM